MKHGFIITCSLSLLFVNLSQIQKRFCLFSLCALLLCICMCFCLLSSNVGCVCVCAFACINNCRLQNGHNNTRVIYSNHLYGYYYASNNFKFVTTIRVSRSDETFLFCSHTVVCYLHRSCASLPLPVHRTILFLPFFESTCRRLRPIVTRSKMLTARQPKREQRKYD